MTPVRPMLSPCVGVCSLDEHGVYCEGCLRTNVEITRWTSMSDDERAHIMDAVLPERESRLR